ncbi:hypothetical protein BRD56_04265 [Thermoplasmatales archaeon SW_10_69_26]|nr:MAG: hypothetical protein BRD56_04265 [Thermoplasmatales archaeon SW_10_69_26]
MAQGRVSLLGFALVAVLALTAGCLEAPGLAQTADEEPPQPSPSAAGPGTVDERPAEHTLRLVAWGETRLSGVLAVEDVELAPVPDGVASFQIGPREDGDATTLAQINATEGARLAPFTVRLQVHDGLGPSELAIEVPAWRAHQDDRIDVHLTLEEVGKAEIDHVDGDLSVEVPQEQGQPRYGYLEWPHGARQPLEDLDRIVSVPADHPRFGAEPEITYTSQTPVEWRLDGRVVAEGTQVTIQPSPGRHTLVLADPAGDQRATLPIAVKDRFQVQDAITVGTASHREPVAGANTDTYNVTIHEGASSLSASLEPVGKQADAEDLDLYAVNASGGVVDQSATNGTEEYMRLSRTDLTGLDHVRLRVHGDTALETEYRLTATTFYRPW